MLRHSVHVGPPGPVAGALLTCSNHIVPAGLLRRSTNGVNRKSGLKEGLWVQEIAQVYQDLIAH